MVSTCLHSVVDATHRDGSIGNGDPLLICHHTLDATVYLQRGDAVGAHIDSMSTPLPSLTTPSVQPRLSHLLHEGKQGLFVVLPLSGQLALVGELVAAQVYRELQAVGMQVAEVIESWTDKQVCGHPLPSPSECLPQALPRLTYSQIEDSTWPH